MILYKLDFITRRVRMTENILKSLFLHLPYLQVYIHTYIQRLA